MVADLGNFPPEELDARCAVLAKRHGALMASPHILTKSLVEAVIAHRAKQAIKHHTRAPMPHRACC